MITFEKEGCERRESETQRASEPGTSESEASGRASEMRAAARCNPAPAQRGGRFWGGSPQGVQKSESAALLSAGSPGSSAPWGYSEGLGGSAFR